jgi:hypothetical protein
VEDARGASFLVIRYCACEGPPNTTCALGDVLVVRWSRASVWWARGKRQEQKVQVK